MKKLLHFENLRVLAVLTVIVTHVVSPLLFVVPTEGLQTDWWIANTIHSLFRFAVPVLFMQSGALLLHPSKKEPVKDFFLKRFSKVLLPFLTWNFVYAVIIAVTSSTPVWIVLMKSLEGSIFYHLWFLYVLFGLYLITPILRVYVRKASYANIAYFLVLWVFITGVNPLLKKLLNYDLEVKIEYLYGYIGYFVLGYYLNCIDISKRVRIIVYIFALLCIPVMIISSYFLTIQNKTPDLFFQEYLSIPVILYSSAVFLFAKYSSLFNTFDINYRQMVNVARICFGVYLSHALVLAVLKYRFHIQATIENPVPGILFTTFLTAVLCFGFFIILDMLTKNPLINRLSRFIY